MLEVLKETKEIKQNLIQYNYHLRMDTVDVSHLFPLQTDDDVREFLRNDQEWNQRKKVFVITI